MKNKKKSRPNIEDDLNLHQVTKSDCRFLYNLLKQRSPQINILHKKMPTFAQHVKFVMLEPYSNWYVIKLKNKKVGSIYLTLQNEIGIFIEKRCQSKGIGSAALQIMIEINPRSRFFANLNPKNTKSIKFFKDHGFKLIQYTYEMTTYGSQ